MELEGGKGEGRGFRVHKLERDDWGDMGGEEVGKENFEILYQLFKLARRIYLI